MTVAEKATKKTLSADQQQTMVALLSSDRSGATVVEKGRYR